MADVYRMLLADERPGVVARVGKALKPKLKALDGVVAVKALRRVSDAGRRGLHPGRRGLEIEILLEGHLDPLAGVLHLETALAQALADLGESLQGTSTWLERAATVRTRA